MFGCAFSKETGGYMGKLKWGQEKQEPNETEAQAQILLSNAKEGWKGEEAPSAEKTERCEDVTAFRIN